MAVEEHHKTDIEWEQLNKKKFFLLMPLCSLTIRVLVYPASVVKTRTQAATLGGKHAENKYNGTLHAFREIARKEGVKGLYRGFGTSLMGMAIGPVYLTTLEYSRSFYKSLGPDAAAASAFLAGGTASIVGQTMGVPLDVVTQRIQMQRTAKADATSTVKSQQSPLPIIKDIFAKEGIKGFYRGYLASLMTYVPSSAIVWSAYSLYKERLRLHVFNTDSAFISPIAGLAAGATSGILINPLDVVRTRLQLRSTESLDKTMLATARSLFREKGWRGFCSGMSARVMVLAPTMGLIFSGYEVLKVMSVKDEVRTELAEAAAAKLEKNAPGVAE